MNESLLYLTCNDSRLLKNLSEFCLKNPKDFSERCLPSDHGLIFIITGIWITVNSIVGSIGNLLTILAIPFAAKRNQ